MKQQCSVWQKKFKQKKPLYLQIQTCRHSLLTEGDTTKRAYTSIGKKIVHNRKASKKNYLYI